MTFDCCHVAKPKPSVAFIKVYKKYRVPCKVYQGWHTESLRPLIFVQKIWLPVLQRWNRNFHGSVYQAGDRRLVCWLHDNNFVSLFTPL